MAGPYYFAWVEPDEEFGPEHVREDEQVLGFRLDHNEGDFPALELEVINPRVGLLSEGRKTWGYLSFDKGGGDVVPLFFGRLIGIPEDLQEEVVTLAFVARPRDYDDQKFVLAASMRVRPYWDPIWFGPESRLEPDNVLESRPQLWHIDRVTHVVSASHIINGEDGVLPLGEGDVLYESMRISYGQTPLSRVDVVADVSWDQVGRGVVDISQRFAFGDPYAILTYTGDGLEKSWPKTGTSLQGGWFVAEGSCARVDGIGQAIWGYGLRNNLGAAAGLSANPFGRSYRAAEEWHDVIVPKWARSGSFSFGGSSIDFPARILGIPRWRMIPRMVLGLDVTRKKGESLGFSLSADVQAILTEPGDEATELLTMSSSEVVSDVDPTDDSGAMGMPIGKLTARSYFPTDRGEQSIEYLIALARSRLLARARCVDVEFEIPFMTAIELDLSCRKDVYLVDYRLPGGNAGGKIKSYTLSVNGDSGVQSCDITIGCTIGKGTSYAAQVGDPTYAEEGYMRKGYQQYATEYIAPFASEVVYESINGVPPNDDGIELDKLAPSDVIIDLQKINGYTVQAAAMGTEADEPNDVYAVLDDNKTKFILELINLETGPFQTNYAMPVSALGIPKTIDLEAGAAS